ncbi:ABC transporter substrate-binding protein [Paenibacillus chartarius]|uniref:ABC transporter substrate-binding protein n=1 Tax=Paenibacillus chartarius TaxID=747481 RepID=A0ABV6DTP8_9BACL
MRKWLVLLSVSALLALAAGGCTTTNTAKVDVPSGSAAEAPKVTIKLLQFKAEITEQVLDMAKQYMAENPDVVIDAQVLKDYDIALVTSFAAGEAPDIFSIKSFTDVQDWSPFLADLSGEPWMSKVSPSAVRGMTVNGRQLGFPMSVEAYGFIYNKDLFAKAGVRQVPTTISELRQVNRKLRAAGIVSYSEGYKEWWVLGQHLLNLPFAYEKEPIGFIEQINRGEKRIADLAKIDGFFDVLDMTLEYGKGRESVGVSYDEQVYAFASGQTAMMQQGVWTLESIRKINPNIRMGMFAIPLSDDPADTKLPVGVPGYYVVNKDSKHLEESKKFLNWLHDNGQKYLVDSFKSIPAFTDLHTTEELGPLAADLTAYAAAQKTIPWAHAWWPSGTIQEFSSTLQAYVGGVLNREQAVAELQRLWEAHHE